MSRGRNQRDTPADDRTWLPLQTPTSLPTPASDGSPIHESIALFRALFAGAYGCAMQLANNPDKADSYVAYCMQLVYMLRGHGILQ